jgi:hypothetical protein
MSRKQIVDGLIASAWRARRATTPTFRTEGSGAQTARVFLQCSLCLVDVREITNNESVDVTVAHYCDRCDPGEVVKNPPISESDKGGK